MTTTTTQPTHRTGQTSGAVSAVVFDFGGVFTASRLAVARVAAQRADIDPDAFIAVMLGDYGVESVSSTPAER